MIIFICRVSNGYINQGVMSNIRVPANTYRDKSHLVIKDALSLSHRSFLPTFNISEILALWHAATIVLSEITNLYCIICIINDYFGIQTPLFASFRKKTLFSLSSPTLTKTLLVKLKKYISFCVVLKAAELFNTMF